MAKLEGTREVQVNLLTNSMQVQYDESCLTVKDIIDAVERAGYGAVVKEEGSRAFQDSGNKEERKEDIVKEQLEEMKTRMIVSFIFMIPLMYVSMGHMAGLPLPDFLSGHKNALSFALTQFLLSLPVLYVNRKYFSKGFQTLFHKAPNMDSLIAIGSGAAMVYGVFALYRIGYGLGHQNMDLVAKYHMDLYFESATMILALITFGKYLEARSKGKTSEAITKLMDMRPKTATVLKNGEEIVIPSSQVAVGDIVIVKPGQSIPIDGIVIEGRSSIDESAITGESIPVEKEKGDIVIGATMNKGGFLKIQASKVGDDTTFAQIIRLVEEAGGSKAPIAKMADKIAGVFVPIVILIALTASVIWLLSGASFEFALSIGICVLVISCPCALGLATPVAIMVGTGKGAENGILIKSGEALETAHSIDCVVFDKTGTITEGKPKVTDLNAFECSKEELLSIAGNLERNSEHPLAEAIMDEVISQGIFKENSTQEVEEFEAVSGMGVRGIIEGKKYYAGNKRFLDSASISLGKYEGKIEEYAKEGKTPLLFADEQKLLGVIAVADVVKSTSKRAVESLKAMGMEVIMLTGDNRKTAEAIRSQVDIDQVIAEVLPADKEKTVAALQEKGKKVAMVGDGINDAPALMRADVGLAIGAGTDVAMESADIILMKNDLLDVVTAIKLSKAVIRNIKENLFWAFFYNSIGIPVAAGVFYPFFGWKLNPMLGALAMSLSSVCVVSNALRLKLFKIEKKERNQEEKKEENEVKTVKIEGMMCMHCVGHVEEALNKISGVEAKVSLEDKCAYITCKEDVGDQDIKRAVEEAGYQVTEIA